MLTEPYCQRRSFGANPAACDEAHEGFLPPTIRTTTTTTESTHWDLIATFKVSQPLRFSASLTRLEGSPFQSPAGPKSAPSQEDVLGNTSFWTDYPLIQAQARVNVEWFISISPVLYPSQLHLPLLRYHHPLFTTIHNLPYVIIVLYPMFEIHLTIKH